MELKFTPTRIRINPFFSLCICIPIFLFSFSENLQAQTSYTWNGSASSAWNNNLNWTPNTGYPLAADHVTITSAGFSPALDGNRSVTNFTISSGTLSLASFTLNITGTASFTSGTINTGTIAPAGSIATFGGTVFGATVNANCASIVLNGSTFNGTANLNKNGSATSTSLGGNTFNGITSISTSGTGNLVLSNTTRDIFNGDVTFSSSASLMHVAQGGSSATQFNGNIIVNSTGTSSGIRFCQGTGTAVLANTKTITVGASGFSCGDLYLKKITQQGISTQVLTGFSGTAGLFFQSGNVFDADVIAAAPGILLDGTTFNGSTTIEKTGSSYSYSQGGNIFNADATIINSGSNELLLAGTTKDIFNSDVTFTSSGSSKINIAYNDASGTQFNGDLYLNSTGSSTGINFCYGTGTAILANGKIISIASSFSSGTLYIRNFTQVGTSAQTLTNFSGTSILQFETGNTFNGNVTFAAPQFYCRATTFNGTASIEKKGTTNNTWYGGNVFNGTTTIKNSGSGSLDLAQTSGDDFNGNVSFIKTGSGALSPLVNGNSTFSKNISTTGSNAQLSFGYTSGSGRMIIDGNSSQSFSADAAYPPFVRALTMSTSSGGTLNLSTNLTVTNDIAFVSGKINATTSSSTSTGLLILNNGITISDAADNNSYVNGYVRKIGNTAFTFPIGNNGYYAPFTISAPALASDHFTAKYENTNPSPSYNTSLHDATLLSVSACEYWMLDRTGGASNVTVNLSWDTRSCILTNLIDTRVARWNGTTWKDEGNGGTTGLIGAGTVVSATALNSFGPFTVSLSNAVSFLPIQLTSFTGSCNDNAVLLNWQTASETNNHFFTIEKSSDGTTWDAAGHVNGSGNSTQVHNYSFTDHDAQSGIVYYRLKQTDFNGEFKYLNIIAVESCKADPLESLTVYPNPSNGVFNLQFTGDPETISSVDVFNLAGEKVYSGNAQSAISLSDQPAGIYFLHYVLASEMIVKKIVVEK